MATTNPVYAPDPGCGLNQDLKKEIIYLWHISRTALATQDHGRHARMIYVRDELKGLILK